MKNTVFVTLNVRIEEDFKVLQAKLKPLHFILSRDGSLVWTNGFNKEQKLSIKPFTEGSPIHAVNFIGPSDNLSAILQNAIGTIEHKILMFRCIFTSESHNNEKYRQLAAENSQWKVTSYNPFIFDCRNEEFSDFICLIEQAQVTYQTRAIKRIAQVNQVVAYCKEYTETFIQSEPFDLFTFENYTETLPQA